MEREMIATAFGSCMNYVDPELNGQQAHESYYTKAVYERLLSIKKMVDPDDIFWNPQAIGT